MTQCPEGPTWPCLSPNTLNTLAHLRGDPSQQLKASGVPRVLPTQRGQSAGGGSAGLWDLGSTPQPLGESPGASCPSTRLQQARRPAEWG